MGLEYTRDTPLKVARFGTSFVLSIIEDEVIEQLRKFHSHENGEEYEPITLKEYISH